MSAGSRAGVAAKAEALVCHRYILFCRPPKCAGRTSGHRRTVGAALAENGIHPGYDVIPETWLVRHPG